MNSRFSTKYITCTAMFVVIAYLAVLATRGIPNVAGFLSYDPKDAVIVIAGFIFGPLTGVIVSVLASFLEFVSVSKTGLYGLLMNVVSTCAFAVPAAWFYQRRRTKQGALIGLGLGVLSMAACMMLWNYIITPFYMGVEREVVAAKLATVFLPFNLVKGGINAGLALLLYKPVVTALRKSGLVEPSKESRKGGFSWGSLLLALAVLVSFGLWFLVLIGVL
ncbi:MAG: ECF transporter S component [Lachnospiraceae bacterium]|nr:ECF transporter S component [Lachnospiraceae bacterium]